MSFLGTARAAGRRLISASLGGRGELAVHASYHRLLRAAGRFGPSEDRGVLDVLASVARGAGTILDVGANVGRFSWYLNRHASSGTPIYAFEPNPNAMALLRRNLHDAPNVHCLELALGDRDGAAFMSVPTDAMGNPVTALGWVATTANVGPEPGGIKIAVRTLDGMVKEGVVRPVPPVLMKLDVEGGEPGVLRGASGFLADYSPIIHFECQRSHLERTGGKPEEVWEALSLQGYAVLAHVDGLYRVCANAVDGVASYLAIPVAEPALASGRLSTGDLAAELNRRVPANHGSSTVASIPRGTG